MKNEIYNFLSLYASQGHKNDTKYILFSLDKFLIKSDLKEKVLSSYYIDGWLNSLTNKISTNTKSVYVSFYNAFAKYLCSIDIPAFIPERPKKEKLYIPYIFSQKELIKIFEVADNFKTLSNSHLLTCIQLPIILRILYGCGMRLGEVLKLKIQDVDLDEGIITIRDAKGYKERLVPMDSSLIEVCKNYYKMAGMTNSDNCLLFSNKQNGYRTKGWMRKCFKQILHHSGIESPKLPRNSRNICIHCLRHTFAVDSFKKQDNNGIDFDASFPLLSVYMGHENLTGTEIYYGKLNLMVS